jgi:hypothetical protein
MIRGSTIVYIVLLLILVGAYLYLNNREQPADIELTVEPGATEAAEAYLFTPEEEGTPTSIRIESKAGEIVEVARGADGAWELKQPDEAPVDQAASEAASSQVTAIRVLDSVPEVDPAIVGLDDPEYVLTVAFTDGGERTVDVGVITPTESGYYVRDTADQIVIVSRSSIDAVLGLLTNPPYMETPTPESVTLEAGTPSSESATSTP